MGDDGGFKRHQRQARALARATSAEKRTGRDRVVRLVMGM